MQILPYSMSISELHDSIDALVAGGNTSSHIGMKWGAAMLDPEFQSVFTSLQNAGDVDASLSDIPANYGEGGVLKIIVVMADGQNTTSYHFGENSAYRGPGSELFLLTFEEMVYEYGYSVYNADRRYYSSYYGSYHGSYCSSNNRSNDRSKYSGK